MKKQQSQNLVQMRVGFYLLNCFLLEINVLSFKARFQSCCSRQTLTKIKCKTEVPSFPLLAIAYKACPAVPQKTGEKCM